MLQKACYTSYLPTCACKIQAVLGVCMLHACRDNSLITMLLNEALLHQPSGEAFGAILYGVVHYRGFCSWKSTLWLSG